MMLRQNHAEQGLHHLSLAVLEALAEGQCIGQSEIQHQSGIDDCLGSVPRWGQFIGTLLNHMEEQGLIEQCQQPGRRKRWRSTSKQTRHDT